MKNSNTEALQSLKLSQLKTSYRELQSTLQIIQTAKRASISNGRLTTHIQISGEMLKSLSSSIGIELEQIHKEINRRTLIGHRKTDSI